jgi:hypothetical protein
MHNVHHHVPAACLLQHCWHSPTLRSSTSTSLRTTAEEYLIWGACYTLWRVVDCQPWLPPLQVNYHIFMYTMYNSPAPSLRQLAAFMKTDLGFRQLEVNLRGFGSWVGDRVQTLTPHSYQLHPSWRASPAAVAPCLCTSGVLLDAMVSTPS